MDDEGSPPEFLGSYSRQKITVLTAVFHRNIGEISCMARTGRSRSSSMIGRGSFMEMHTGSLTSFVSQISAYVNVKSMISRR
jgi:hypothetical protein